MGRRHCGSGPALVLPEGHLSALAHENAPAAGHPVSEPEDGVHGSPAGLDALAPPERLLGVGAEGPCEAAPAEAAGLIEAFKGLGEVLRRDA